MRPDEWRAKGTTVKLPEWKVFALEEGARRGADVLLLHGFPTSSWDFAKLVPLLSGRRRVVTFDFMGFGFSEKPAEFGYTLFEQADVALAVAKALGVERAHVVAHDMGTSVATELLARREQGLSPLEIESLTLMNGSVHMELVSLTVGQRILKSPLGPLFARVSNARSFAVQIRRILAKPVADEELAAMWELLAREDGALRLPAIIDYTRQRVRHARRWIGALERLDLPAMVAWGKKDPVAVYSIAERLAREIPNARFETWEDLGHYPQVEDPEAVARTLESFFTEVDARALAKRSRRA
ncbi:MAG: alpha/beta hydrolase [Myxococcales bacterium]|nr:alpha/beta hydrolase [Myxococcales bacterium]